jgi:hypothetical protein
MDVFKMIQRYNFDILKWESKEKISENGRKKLQQFLKQNKIFGILVQSFDNNGYYSFIHRKKKLCKYIPIPNA